MTHDDESDCDWAPLNQAAHTISAAKLWLHTRAVQELASLLPDVVKRLTTASKKPVPVTAWHDLQSLAHELSREVGLAMAELSRFPRIHYEQGLPRDARTIDEGSLPDGGTCPDRAEADGEGDADDGE